jgi:hypothetical protein
MSSQSKDKITLKQKGFGKNEWVLFKSEGGLVLQRTDKSEEHLFSKEDFHAIFKLFGIRGIYAGIYWNNWRF